MNKNILRKLKREKAILLNSYASQEMCSLQGIKVMAIDDCVDTLNILRNFFKGLPGICLSTFSDEFLAVGKFMGERPDIVILDMNLKNLNGFKVSEVMRNLSLFNVPIVYISQNKLMEKDIKKVYGQDSYFLSKPLGRNTFFSTMEEVITKL